MKKLVLLMVVLLAFCLVFSGTVFANSYHRGSSRNRGYHLGGGYHTGREYRPGGHRDPGALLGRIMVGAALGYIMVPRAYTPRCYNEVVVPGYYYRDYYGRLVRVPPVVERVCY